MKRRKKKEEPQAHVVLIFFPPPPLHPTPGTLINSTREISSFSSTCKSTDITFRGQRRDATGNDKLVKNFNLRVDRASNVSAAGWFERSIP